MAPTCLAARDDFVVDQVMAVMSGGMLPPCSVLHDGPSNVANKPDCSVVNQALKRLHQYYHVEPDVLFIRSGVEHEGADFFSYYDEELNDETIQIVETNSKGGVAAWPDVPKQTGTLGNLTPADRHGSVQFCVVYILQPERLRL
uniref:Casein kinase 1 gamma C-terminal domain-containing protein n=1 Tax=Anopheles maculatus TaxID=74869 RepID=A0A182TBT0_9DIPT